MDILKKLKAELTGENLVIIGLGNRDMGDDAAGILITEDLKNCSSGQTFNENDGLGHIALKIIDDEQISSILFIDAMDFGGVGGDIKIFNDQEIPDLNLVSSHQFNPGIYSALFNKYRKKCFLLGIQVENVGLKSEISKAVKSKITDLVGLLKSF